MRVSIDKDVFKKLHPKLKVAFFLVQHIKNEDKLQESRHLLKEAETYIRLTFNKDTIKTHHLISPWVTAQEEFGSKARHYHSSVERLLKTVLDRREVTGKNVITNVSNYLALKHLVPFGADDYGKINGNIHFNVASGKERIGILKRLKQGDIYYKDEAKRGSVLGTKLDYWKNKRTKLSAQTHSALVHIEAMPPVSSKEFNQIVKETKSLLEMFSGSSVETLILQKRKLQGNLGAIMLEKLEPVSKIKKKKVKVAKKKRKAFKNMPPAPVRGGKKAEKESKRKAKAKNIQASKPKRKTKHIPPAPRKSGKAKKRPRNVKVRKTDGGIPKPPKRKGIFSRK